MPGGLLSDPSARTTFHRFQLYDRDETIGTLHALNSLQYKSLQIPHSSSIILDLGSFEVRAGFSNESNPRLYFPPVVSRGRDRKERRKSSTKSKSASENDEFLNYYANKRNYIGYQALSSHARSAARSVFESDVFVNTYLLERMLDETLIKLGLSNEEQIFHPVLVTETLCNLNSVRNGLLEILFDAYQISNVCLAIDALLSYLYNNNTKLNGGELSYGNENALVLSASHSASHVMPLVGGRVVPTASKRLAVGGAVMSSTLQKRLQLLHPAHSAILNSAISASVGAGCGMSRVDIIKESVCETFFPKNYAQNYTEFLKYLESSVEEYENQEVFVSVAQYDASGNYVKASGSDVVEGNQTGKVVLSAEEMEIQKQKRIEAGRRLFELMQTRRNEAAAAVAASEDLDGGAQYKSAAAKSGRRAIFTKEEAKGLNEALEELYQMEELVSELNVVVKSQEAWNAAAEGPDRTEIEKRLYSEEDKFFKRAVSLGCGASLQAVTKRMREVTSRVDDERMKLNDEMKSNAIEGQFRKRKRDEILLNTPDSKLDEEQLKDKRKAKALRAANAVRERAKLQRDEEKRMRELERTAREKSKKENPEAFLDSLKEERDALMLKMKRREAARLSGSDRRSVASRNRMRLLAQQADGVSGSKSGGKSGEEDTFGMADSDWDVYREMQGENSEEEQEDEQRLNELNSEIAEMAPQLDVNRKPRGFGSVFFTPDNPDEIPMVVDRFRTLETVWQPSIVGIDQCGLAEAINLSLNALHSDVTRSNVVQEVFLTGGIANSKGMKERVHSELVSMLPIDFGHRLKVSVASHPMWDAWRGGALFAEHGGDVFRNACISKADYEEMGGDYLKEHLASNVYVPTPDVERPLDSKKKRKR
uniref:Actin-related protein 5 n=1 Tax=Timspurckia oligopyrenoides TaxID=708627 RepID=A0A7S1EUS8_9RHOD|mmetsp:Transcript_9451/g.17057  ORF Transcript_9451/g.17057 Transcript_9451/m.17057 type:complete len:879 (+) Transcript_9451:52-2688(+)